MAMASSSGLRSCSAVGVPSLLAPSSRSGRSGLPFCAYATTSGRVTMSAEIYHCRWAMLCVPGVLVPEALGLGNWVKAQEWAALPDGQATYLGNPVPWGNLPTILAIEFLAIAFAEQQRTMEKDPEKKKYPGGAFDPLGFSKDPAKFEELKLKEIKNGRLAMLAFVGFCVQQSAYPGTGPLENLATHLADPWHNNIGDIVIPRNIYGP
ncbi:unnamed protein product [Triticum turgidum subsp. durum]|uniref:Chlorophyll a-b binding protein, chloroplastic n=1 Tax=Triticum turgidum subsp. durum TaxID=4567 RepID=A0A9R0ZA70_TRITD|nr:unnamed protein product [Triticum turgidum subsp. durum]